MRLKEGNKEQDILNAAIEIFAENGFYKSKIVDIAEKANVAIGSVYVYYKNKHDILLKIFDNIWHPLYTEIKQIADNKSLSHAEKFDYIIDLVFDSFIEEPQKAIVFVNDQHHLMKERPNKFTNYYELFIKEGEKIFSSGVRSGVYNKINIPIFRKFILGGLRELLREWAANPSTRSLNKIRQSVKFFCKHGIMQ
jgi:TetR/AcrR family fatty acid metabolism transcriptional regulator